MECAPVEPAFSRRLRSLSGLAVRRGAWRGLARRKLASLAEVVDGMLGRVVAGDGDASDALLAFGSWVIGEREEGRSGAVEQLRRSALEAELGLVALLLTDPPPFKALAPRGRLHDSNHPMGLQTFRDPERQWLWRYEPWLRGWERSVARVDRPEVLRHALRNRRLRESVVVEIAARRPTTPALLRDIVLRDEWLTVPAVRRALVMNPYAPTGTQLALLPTVGASCWRELREGVAHPLLVQGARRLAAVGPEPGD